MQSADQGAEVSTERVDSLTELLEQALRLTPQERVDWLRQLAARDPALEPLLREALADRKPQGETVRTNHPGPPTSSLVETPGSHIGPYRLLRLLGAGGMGAVWLAERDDGQLTRRIALKLPHLWISAFSDELRAERDILAALEHPHIARLYDAGVTLAGRPYLALEYVDGKPIDVYCRERDFSVQQRVKLFLQVVQAVAYAHARLVVHRDLKPANILVAADGTPRLLDFGIARLLETPAGAGSTQLGRAYTPEYASPEQLAGERISLLSDVYSLGVVLFELLTDALPVKAPDDAPAGPRVTVDPPSVKAPSRASQLRGDLDLITLKALAVDPSQRYASVTALADDLERFLSGRPVLARRPSRWYRLSKFVRRNRYAVLAAVLAALVATIGGSVSVWQARFAREQQRRAENLKRFLAQSFATSSTRAGAAADVSAVDLLVTQSIDPFVRRWLANETPSTPLEEWKVLVACRDAQRTVSGDDLDALAAEAEAQATSGQPVERRRRALFVMGHLQRLRSVNALLAAAKSPPAELQAEGLTALGLFGSRSVFEQRELKPGITRRLAFPPQPTGPATAQLLESARHPPSAERSAALRALATHSGPRVAALATELMRQHEPGELVLPLLQDVATPEARRFITDQLRSGRVAARRRAVELLFDHADVAMRPALVAAIADPDDEVSTGALASLRALEGLPSRPLPAVARDRAMLQQLWRPEGRAVERDPSVPAAIEAALGLRVAEPRAAVKQLEQLADEAARRGDVRTAALARHRAGDVWADLHECFGAADAYWRALVLNEGRGDVWQVAIAANDLGALFRQCGYYTGDADVTFYRYAAQLRRPLYDDEALRRTLNNLGCALVARLELAEAKVVLAEALALALKLNDPVAEWKIRTNDAYRQYLACTVFAEVFGAVEQAPECRVVDGQVTHTDEAIAQMQRQLALAAKAATAAGQPTEVICRSLPPVGRPLCRWLPRAP